MVAQANVVQRAGHQPTYRSDEDGKRSIGPALSQEIGQDGAPAGVELSDKGGPATPLGSESLST